MTAAIQLRDVCRQYQLGAADVFALTHINLEIGQGDFVALAGPSGSGKSTLLNLLGGLDKPSSGEIVMQGLPLQDAGENQLTAHRRHNVGFIFQTFNLLPTLTALENVALPLMLCGVGLAERQSRAAELLGRVGLSHRLDHRPTEMSGGEQQRTAIARALVNNPQLVLADEPTGNLDSTTGAEVMHLLRELNAESGVTLVVVTHDADVAAFAGRIVHLKDGGVFQIEENKKASSKSLPSPAPSSNLALSGGLSFKDLLRTAFENLRRRPIRNILTAAGVLIGIITLVAMVSFGVGVQNEVNRNFQALGLENVFVSPTYPEEQDAFDPFGIAEPEQPLTPELASAFQAMPETSTVTPILDLPSNMEISLAYQDTSLPVRISSSMGGGRAGPPSIFEPDEMLAGAALAEGDSQGLVLIHGLADRLLGVTEDEQRGHTAPQSETAAYESLVGQSVTLTIRLPRGETRDFETRITGVRQSVGSRTVDLGIVERVAIKAWWYGRPDTLSTDGYDMLIVRAVDEAAVPAVLAAAEDMDLQAQSLGAFLEIANRVLAIMQALLGSVGALALLVATLGVANTMMMAIYERTREIGVLKALGATNGEVRRMFTADAVLLGFIGGVFGLILGALLGRLVDWAGHVYLASEGVTGIGRMSIVPPWLAIGSLVFASFIGILGGLYPAQRAAKLDPVVALRHE